MNKKINSIPGNELHQEIKKKFNITTNTELANILGYTPQNISAKQNRNLTAKSISTYIKKAYEEGKKLSLSESIKRIIEYSPIMQNSRTSRFTNPPNTQINYRELLSGKRGVYIFYDSLYKPIYVGKTTNQDLWNEMNIAYNNKDIQGYHRMCASLAIKIRDVAHFVSAYQIQNNDLISLVEAVMIRSFINVLQNIRAERIPEIK